MTNVYLVTMTGQFTPNTDQLAVEIQAPASKTVKIKKIRVMHSDGTDANQAGTVDYHARVKLVAESVAGTGGTSFTPVGLDGATTAAQSTVNTGPFTVGSISTTFDIISKNSIVDFYWQAADEQDKMVLSAGGIFGLVLYASEA